MYSLAELKQGLTIEVDGTPYIVLQAYHSKQARATGVAKTSLKNLLTGAIIQKTFQGNERIDEAHITHAKAQYLYKDAENAYFMDSQSFEQFHFPIKELENKMSFLTEEQELDIQHYEGKPINVLLPPKVDLKVIQAEPGVKGNTASGGSKSATVTTGYTLQVPLFINEEDTIRINTETGQYVERA